MWKTRLSANIISPLGFPFFFGAVFTATWRTQGPPPPPPPLPAGPAGPDIANCFCLPEPSNGKSGRALDDGVRGKRF
jgi:hypothetical protein